MKTTGRIFGTVFKTSLIAFGLAAATIGSGAEIPEFLSARQWADRHFGPSLSATNVPSLKVLFEDVADNISRGRSWRGTPYQLGDQTFSHGIAFNSTKHLLIRLGQPGEVFRAIVGLENNDDTRRGAEIGKGSVRFHVLVGGQEVFTSPVRRLKDGGQPLEVPLNGATEFEIRVTDAGDGRGWDQALWAEAVVALQDGDILRLQDFPWSDSIGSNSFGISFLYDKKPSAEILGKWQRHYQERPVDSQRTLREITYHDPQTGLELRIEATLFTNFPAVEWVAYLRNTAATNTPILENIQAFDGAVPVQASSGQTTLHWAKGAVASFDDFAPQQTTFKPGVKLALQPGGGRSSSQVLPFFNCAGADGGVITAIGWSGEWAAEFLTTPKGDVSLKSGMARTHLRLLPGETIRTPRMLFLFYTRDRWHGQNQLRHFILSHHRPQPNGKPLVAPITCGNWGGTRAEVHLDNIRKIDQHRLPLDYYWIDAEWFGTGGWAASVGDWRVKKALYPDGFKPLSQALRQSGRELMLWFEPERVFKGTPWHAEHRNWLLDLGQDSALLNLGNPDALQFLTDFISTRIEEFGLGCYRQDFNIDPLPFWQAADAPDRQGITEIRYIEGLYAFWDALLARHPGLIIDNCASGGRRIDLETIGRATPFWRTDGPRDAIAHQCHTYGLMPWVPLSATSQDRAEDNYEFRSSMCSSLCLNWWISGDAPAERIRSDFPFAWARRTLEQYVSFRGFYYGDFYPLTSYSQDRDVWLAYQLDMPEQGQGMIVALRRPDSPYESARLRLRGFSGSATYDFVNLDTEAKLTLTADDLQQRGFEVRINQKPGSALWRYQRR